MNYRDSRTPNPNSIEASIPTKSIPFQQNSNDHLYLDERLSQLSNKDHEVRNSISDLKKRITNFHQREPGSHQQCVSCKEFEKKIQEMKDLFERKIKEMEENERTLKSEKYEREKYMVKLLNSQSSPHPPYTSHFNIKNYHDKTEDQRKDYEEIQHKTEKLRKKEKS